MNEDLIKRIDEALEPPTDIGSAWVVLEDCRDEIQRLESELAKAKWYEPMTDDEFHTIWIESDGFNATETLQIVEAEIIKRAGLIVKERDNG